MKTVIEFTTYDGTDETLPNTGYSVLLIRSRAVRCVEESRLIPIQGHTLMDKDHPVNKWQCHRGDRCYQPQIGDMWSYWPQLPEDMGVRKPIGMCDALYAHRLEKVVKAAKAFYDEWDRSEDGYMLSLPITDDLRNALDGIKDMMK